MIKKFFQYYAVFGIIFVILFGIPVARASYGGGAFSGGTLSSTIADTLYCKLTGCTVAGTVSATGFVGTGSGGYSITGGGAALDYSCAAGDTCTLSSSGGAIQVFTSKTSAGVNAQIFSSANALGEYGVIDGTDANLAAATLDTQVWAACYNCNATPVYPLTVNGAGHITSGGGSTPSSYTSGTCSSETGTGNDTRGSITATCTAGQTAIVTFGRAYTTAPICVCSPSNAAGDPVTSGAEFCTASTTVMTLTTPTAVTTGSFNFICME